MLTYRRICTVIAILFCVFLLPIQALAAGTVDLQKHVNLTIEYTDDKNPVSGITFELYYAASIDKSGTEFALAEDFAKYPVQVNGLDSAGWKALAETLSGYVKRDGLKALDSGTTDRKGQLEFPTKQTKLLPGLYLVVGQLGQIGNTTYTTEPFFVTLPGLDQNDSWDYSLTVQPKYAKEQRPSGGSDNKTTSRKVLKVWEDNGTSDNRPKEITVQLLKNGQVFDSIQLDEACNWKHLWTDLPKYENGRLIDWTVVESAEENYTVSVIKEGITFVVTNTREETPPENPPDNPPDTPSDNPPDNPPDTPSDNPPDTPSNNPPDNPSEPPSLPQTGVLWWPIPLLAACGSLCLAIGLFLKRKRHE